MQLFYCAIVLLIFGLLLSLIVSDIKALMPVGMTIMFILFMVIGVFVQYSSLPKIIRTISSYIPVKYLANDFYYIWIGQAKWNMPFFKCNTIWLIFLCLICYIIYRRKNNVTKIFN
ncbi:ABC transporter permease [Lactobacillus crispatus]|uniref:ABC transporter permease n=1 Tax=Lactobacillus crispatus TaxID=47770 RepID=UPI0030F7E413